MSYPVHHPPRRTESPRSSQPKGQTIANGALSLHAILAGSVKRRVATSRRVSPTTSSPRNPYTKSDYFVNGQSSGSGSGSGAGIAKITTTTTTTTTAGGSRSELVAGSPSSSSASPSSQQQPRPPSNYNSAAEDKMRRQLRERIAEQQRQQQAEIAKRRGEYRLANREKEEDGDEDPLNTINNSRSPSSGDSNSGDDDTSDEAGPSPPTEDAASNPMSSEAVNGGATDDDKVGEAAESVPQSRAAMPDPTVEYGGGGDKGPPPPSVPSTKNKNKRNDVGGSTTRSSADLYVRLDSAAAGEEDSVASAEPSSSSKHSSSEKKKKKSVRVLMREKLQQQMHQQQRRTGGGSGATESKNEGGGLGPSSSSSPVVGSTKGTLRDDSRLTSLFAELGAKPLSTSDNGGEMKKKPNKGTPLLLSAEVLLAKAPKATGIDADRLATAVADLFDALFEGYDDEGTTGGDGASLETQNGALRGQLTARTDRKDKKEAAKKDPNALNFSKGISDGSSFFDPPPRPFLNFAMFCVVLDRCETLRIEAAARRERRREETARRRGEHMAVSGQARAMEGTSSAAGEGRGATAHRQPLESPRRAQQHQLMGAGDEEEEEGKKDNDSEDGAAAGGKAGDHSPSAPYSGDMAEHILGVHRRGGHHYMYKNSPPRRHSGGGGFANGGRPLSPFTCTNSPHGGSPSAAPLSGAEGVSELAFVALRGLEKIARIRVRHSNAGSSAANVGPRSSPPPPPPPLSQASSANQQQPARPSSSRPCTGNANMRSHLRRPAAGEGTNGNNTPRAHSERSTFASTYTYGSSGASLNSGYQQQHGPLAPRPPPTTSSSSPSHAAAASSGGAAGNAYGALFAEAVGGGGASTPSPRARGGLTNNKHSTRTRGGSSHSNGGRVRGSGGGSVADKKERNTTHFNNRPLRMRREGRRLYKATGADAKEVITADEEEEGYYAAFVGSSSRAVANGEGSVTVPARCPNKSLADQIGAYYDSIYGWTSFSSVSPPSSSFAAAATAHPLLPSHLSALMRFARGHPSPVLAAVVVLQAALQSRRSQCIARVIEFKRWETAEERGEEVAAGGEGDSGWRSGGGAIVRSRQSTSPLRRSASPGRGGGAASHHHPALPPPPLRVALQLSAEALANAARYEAAQTKRVRDATLSDTLLLTDYYAPKSLATAEAEAEGAGDEGAAEQQKGHSTAEGGDKGASRPSHRPSAPASPSPTAAAPRRHNNSSKKSGNAPSPSLYHYYQWRRYTAPSRAEAIASERCASPGVTDTNANNGARSNSSSKGRRGSPSRSPPHSRPHSPSHHQQHANNSAVAAAPLSPQERRLFEQRRKERAATTIYCFLTQAAAAWRREKAAAKIAAYLRETEAVSRIVDIQAFVAAKESMLNVQEKITTIIRNASALRIQKNVKGRVFAKKRFAARVAAAEAQNVRRIVEEELDYKISRVQALWRGRCARADFAAKKALLESTLVAEADRLDKAHHRGVLLRFGTLCVAKWAVEVAKRRLAAATEARVGEEHASYMDFKRSQVAIIRHFFRLVVARREAERRRAAVEAALVAAERSDRAEQAAIVFQRYCRRGNATRHRQRIAKVTAAERDRQVGEEEAQLGPLPSSPSSSSASADGETDAIRALAGDGAAEGEEDAYDPIAAIEETAVADDGAEATDAGGFSLFAIEAEAIDEAGNAKFAASNVHDQTTLTYSVAQRPDEEEAAAPQVTGSGSKSIPAGAELAHTGDDDPIAAIEETAVADVEANAEDNGFALFAIEAEAIDEAGNAKFAASNVHDQTTLTYSVAQRPEEEEEEIANAASTADTDNNGPNAADEAAAPSEIAEVNSSGSAEGQPSKNMEEERNAEKAAEELQSNEKPAHEGADDVSGGDKQLHAQAAIAFQKYCRRGNAARHRQRIAKATAAERDRQVAEEEAQLGPLPSASSSSGSLAEVHHSVPTTEHDVLDGTDDPIAAIEETAGAANDGEEATGGIALFAIEAEAIDEAGNAKFAASNVHDQTTLTYSVAQRPDEEVVGGDHGRS